jgi:hypothetical protein
LTGENEIGKLKREKERRAKKGCKLKQTPSRAEEEANPTS